MKPNLSENIKYENYQEQVDWFNNCIKPKIITPYNYQPVQERLSSSRSSSKLVLFHE